MIILFIKVYTRVLMGAIDLARATFLDGTPDTRLDILARWNLFKVGLNYRHGTGHGIGSYGFIHESPIQVSITRKQLFIYSLINSFSNFSCMFLKPNIFSNLNYNCSNSYDVRNLQEKVKKAFWYQKLFWPFTVWIKYSSSLNSFANSQ